MNAAAEIREIANRLIEKFPPRLTFGDGLTQDELYQQYCKPEGIKVTSRDGAGLHCNQALHTYHNPLTAVSFSWNTFGVFNIEGEQAFSTALKEIQGLKQKLEQERA